MREQERLLKELIELQKKANSHQIMMNNLLVDIFSELVPDDEDDDDAGTYMDGTPR